MNDIELLIIGDVAIDVFFEVDEKYVVNNKLTFDHGSKIISKKVNTGIAGNACNVAIGSAKLGVQCAVYTELGDDENADKFINTFKKNKINTDFCVRNFNRNTNVHAVIASKGERTILTYHQRVSYFLQKWQKPKWIYYTSLSEGFESFQDQLEQYIKKSKDIALVVNPGTYQLNNGLEKIKQILPITSVLILNKEEAELISGVKSKDINKMHEKICTYGVKLSVITDGKNGATCSDGKRFLHYNSIGAENKPVDKTGAGDAFSSAFVSALITGKNLKEAMVWGTINASEAIKEVGAITGLKTTKEMQELVKNYVKSLKNE